jgi:hypothetical protein
MARRTVDIEDALLARLDAARDQDGVPAATRIRAMVHVWGEDPDTQAKVDEAAQALHRRHVERMRRAAAAARAHRWQNRD